MLSTWMYIIIPECDPHTCPTGPGLKCGNWAQIFLRWNRLRPKLTPSER